MNFNSRGVADLSVRHAVQGEGAALRAVELAGAELAGGAAERGAAAGRAVD